MSLKEYILFTYITRQQNRGASKEKNIVIGSLYPRNRTTFVSYLIARSIAHYQVSTLYVEDPLLVPYTYDRFYGHEFDPYYRSKWVKQQEDLPDIQDEWS